MIAKSQQISLQMHGLLISLVSFQHHPSIGGLGVPINLRICYRLEVGKYRGVKSLNRVALFLKINQNNNIWIVLKTTTYKYVSWRDRESERESE